MGMRSSAAALAAVTLVLAAAVDAAPYAVTHTDLMNSNTAFPPGIIAGQNMSTTFVLDNGGGVATNQTWGAGNVQCVIFRFNNAANLFLAVNYVGSPFSSSTTGSFATDGAGALQAGTITWVDFPPTIAASKYVTNVAGAGTLEGWFINAINDVVLYNGNSPSVGYVNVANDTSSANWSNPVPAGGLCATFLNTTPQVVPTVNQWGLIVLATLLAAAALVVVWRKRA